MYGIFFRAIFADKKLEKYLFANDFSDFRGCYYDIGSVCICLVDTKALSSKHNHSSITMKYF